jgi:hypothetical protein
MKRYHNHYMKRYLSIYTNFIQVSSSQPKFRPSLCRKSLEMSDQHFKGYVCVYVCVYVYVCVCIYVYIYIFMYIYMYIYKYIYIYIYMYAHIYINTYREFLDRVERDVLRRSDFEMKQFAATDYSCTFQPVILEKSNKLRGRSVYEMSKGRSFIPYYHRYFCVYLPFWLVCDTLCL